MADQGYLLGELAGISNANDRRILERVVRHLVQDLRFGAPEHQARATNFGAYYQASTTAGSTGEFSVAHGMSVTPRLAVPVLDLNAVGSQVVPLEVTRVADGKRIYLRSTSTGAQFMLLVE